MLDEDEEYEDDVLYKRRSTPVLRSARAELVVPTSSTTWRLPGAPNRGYGLRACARCEDEARLYRRVKTRFAV